MSCDQGFLIVEHCLQQLIDHFFIGIHGSDQGSSYGNRSGIADTGVGSFRNNGLGVEVVILLQLFAVMFLSACSNGEHVVDLKSPIEVVSYNNGPKVCIADVTDNRLFVGNENQPNLPSGEILSPDYKSRAYARLKNTFGSQTGSMLLPRDKTVTMVVREILERALSDDGYTVVQEAAAEDSDTIIMAVSIKQFWTWAGLDKINDNINSDIELDVYTQNQLQNSLWLISTTWP